MTEGQALSEELVLQPPVGPILLRLAMDLHVSIAGLDFIEHSGAKRKTEMKGRSENRNHLLARPQGKHRKICAEAFSSMTCPTHLPHSLQGKKLANEGTGTASSRPNCLSTG